MSVDLSSFLRDKGPELPIDCGYYICDQRTHYCQEDTPGVEHTKECLPCSDVCSRESYYEDEWKHCTELCPTYAYIQSVIRSNTQAKVINGEEVDVSCKALIVSTSLLGVILFIVLCCVLYRYRKQCVLFGKQLRAWFKKACSRNRETPRNEEGMEFYIPENVPEADHRVTSGRETSSVHSSVTRTQRDDNVRMEEHRESAQSSLISQQDAPVEETVPYQRQQMCIG